MLGTFYSVGDIASQLAVKDDKVLAWIGTGELIASNVATNRTGRPRWRISQESLDAFLLSRAAVPTARTPATRRRTPKASGQCRQWIK